MNLFAQPMWDVEELNSNTSFAKKQKRTKKDEKKKKKLELGDVFTKKKEKTVSVEKKTTDMGRMLDQGIVTSAVEPGKKKKKSERKTQNQQTNEVSAGAEQHIKDIPKMKEKKKKKKEKHIEDKVAVSDPGSNIKKKLKKLFKLEQKVQKANAVRVATGQQSSVESAKPSVFPKCSPSKTPLTEEERKRLLRVKKAEKRRNRRWKTASRQSDKEKNTQNSEVLLSRAQKKKMRKVARKEEKPGKKMPKKPLLSGENNFSYDNSAIETAVSVSESKGSSGTNDKKKKKKRKKTKASKKQVSSEDSADGNLVSMPLSAQEQSDVPPDNSLMKKKNLKLKKDKIAILLNMSGSETPNSDKVGKNTLHNLKKKRRLEGISNDTKIEASTKKSKTMQPLRERMTEQLKSSRFRWLNEQLYTSNSWDALKYFKDDPEAFEAYHAGYRNQVALWLLNPLDVIIKSLTSLSPGTVVADFGCGEARLADSLPNLKVHSLDLVASKPNVVACDMAHTPLLMGSVDVAVFCLSLMGTNLNDFLLEANRVLKVGGLLKIAEVESRFEDVDNFASELQHFGFQLKKKDFSNKLFYFMDFKKVRNVSKTGKLPKVELSPCMYKKR